MRIAMVVPEPKESGGVPGTVRLLAHGLAALGHEVDAYTTVDDPARAELLVAPGLRPMAVDTRFRWGRWYSRPDRPMTAHLTQLATRAVATEALARRLVEEHARAPYDVVYRFSTIELLGLGRRRGHLPPIVVHPEVHAAGERAAMRRERALARRCEAGPRRAMAASVLSVRAARQRRTLAGVAGVIAPSRAFADHLVRDYGVEPSLVAVAPNPVDLDEFGPPPTRTRRPGEPWRLLFVGRISVRKGIDQLVALSHRLRDLAGRVELTVVGGPTLWSDYRALLRGLDDSVARYAGPVRHHELPALMAHHDALIQPSTYEPFAITVAEGLAAGLPVVATTEVGAAEEVDPSCCLRVVPGRADELEVAVRALLDRLEAGDGPALARTARAEAERLFTPERAATMVAEALRAATRRSAAFTGDGVGERREGATVPGRGR